MKTIEIKLYSFDELSQEAKEKAINDCRNNQHYLDYDWWDGVYDTFHEKAKAKGFDVDKIYFSGFWSQGDGAMFEYSKDTDKLFNEFVEKLKIFPMRKQWLLTQGVPYMSGKHRGHYYHSKCCEHSIGIESNFHWSCAELFSNWIESFSDDFNEFVTDIYEDLCDELYGSLEAEYEWLISDEVIAEHLIANEYQFTEDGKIH